MDKQGIKNILAKTNVAVAWSEVALWATRNSSFGPTQTARNLYMVHAAMYNALTVFYKNLEHEGSYFWGKVGGSTKEKREVAVSFAAYTMLDFLFPGLGKTGMLKPALHIILTPQAIADNPMEMEMGKAAASRLFEDRLGDGSNINPVTGLVSEATSFAYPIRYLPVNEAGLPQNSPLYQPPRWQPLVVAGLAQKPLTQHWGNVRPFALTTGSQLRPDPPPTFGDFSTYVDGRGNKGSSDSILRLQMQEVLDISYNLTPKEKATAEYWEDGPRSETPPGHWMAICHDLIYRDGLALEKSIMLMYALGGALLDSSIVCWETKRAYDSPRPASTIRWMYWGKNVMAWRGSKGAGPIDGAAWRPYQRDVFPTPPFQGYTSGHATFSKAAATILSRFLGSDSYYDGTATQVRPDPDTGQSVFLGQFTFKAGASAVENNSPKQDVVLSWNTLEDAAEDAGMSRLYGGIHIREDNYAGQGMGIDVAEAVIKKTRKLWGKEWTTW